MALVNCRECKREISDQAAACPHCGAPVKAPPPQPQPLPPAPRVSGCAPAVLIVLALIFVPFACSRLLRDAPTVATTTDAAAAVTPSAPAPLRYAVKVVAFECYSKYGRDRAKITVRNTGEAAIPYAKIFIEFRGKAGQVLSSEDTYFSPVEIPVGATASADVYAEGGGAASCVPSAMQDGRGAAVQMTQ